MTEPTYAAVITAPVVQSTIRGVTDEMNLWWAMNVWWGEDAPPGAEKHNDPEWMYVLYAEDGEQWSSATEAKAHGVKTHLKSVSWKHLVDALAWIARGDVIRDPYQVRAAMDIITRPADADWDADTGQWMTQRAVFGELIFG